MNNQNTLFEQCKCLKLDGFMPILEADNYEEKTPFEFLSELLSAQLSLNTERKISRLIKQAKLKYPDVYLSDIDYALLPSLKVNQINQLAECHWVKTNRNIIIVGPTGTGKTSLACRLGQAVISQQQSVVFYRLSHLLL